MLDYNITIFFLSNRKNGDKDPHVDPRFVALLKTTVGKLAGENVIDRSIIDLEFWSKWPSKFREAKRYEKKSTYTKYLPENVEKTTEVTSPPRHPLQSSPPPTGPIKRAANVSHFNHALKNRGITKDVLDIKGYGK